MAAPNEAIEASPLWHSSGEVTYFLPRAELIGLTPSPSVNVVPGDTAALTNVRALRAENLCVISGTGRIFEPFPSVVPITWYGETASRIGQIAFPTQHGFPGEGQVGHGARMTTELPMFFAMGTAPTYAFSNSSLSPLPQPGQSNYQLAFIDQVVEATGQWTTNFVAQLNHPATSLSYRVVSTNASAIESAGPPNAYAIPISDPVHSALAKRIRVVYESTQLDRNAVEAARRAVNDAIRFVDFNLPGGEPLVMLSDDGVLSLQWRFGDRGLMLVFTGDGTGTYSIREPGGFYATGAEDFSLEKGLVEEVRAVMDNRTIA